MPGVAIFVMQILAWGLIVGVVAIVHDLIFDWVEVQIFSIDSAPHELAGNDRTWRVTVKMWIGNAKGITGCKCQVARAFHA